MCGRRSHHVIHFENGCLTQKVSIKQLERFQERERDIFDALEVEAMSTAGPSKATGGGTGHSRTDPTARFILEMFVSKRILTSICLDPSKVRSHVWRPCGPNGTKRMSMPNRGTSAVGRRKRLAAAKDVPMSNLPVQR